MQQRPGLPTLLPFFLQNWPNSVIRLHLGRGRLQDRRPGQVQGLVAAGVERVRGGPESGIESVGRASGVAHGEGGLGGGDAGAGDGGVGGCKSMGIVRDAAQTPDGGVIIGASTGLWTCRKHVLGERLLHISLRS